MVNFWIIQPTPCVYLKVSLQYVGKTVLNRILLNPFPWTNPKEQGLNNSQEINNDRTLNKD